MGAYYNENDPFAAQWLRNLIAAGHIAPGEVDTRSIEDVSSDDLRGFQQCHFFAGIGVWSKALRDAGWPDDRVVWTGSCPCQPFSAAGKRGGTTDERHLWPAFYHLIEERRPPIVLGEQVASKDALHWLDLVYADLEASGYAVGAFDLSAAGFGAPHARQRLYFVGVDCRPDADRRDGHGRHSNVQVGRQRNARVPSEAPDRKGNQWASEPRPAPLAYGVAARMEQCCAYGNAIVAEAAREFIGAVTDALGSS